MEVLPVEFLCPGDRHPIDRAVHLARLASFYPPCRDCPHREDAGTMSKRRIRLLKARSAEKNGPQFHSEGFTTHVQSPAAAKDIERVAGAFSHAVCQGDAASQPTILLAGDGRATTIGLVQAASEAIRRSGVAVIDLGAATAGCLQAATVRFRACGALFIQTRQENRLFADASFWNADARPLSLDFGLDAVKRAFDAPRPPRRRMAAVRRMSGHRPYLDSLRPHFHALRPLRLRVQTASHAAIGYLDALRQAVACRFVYEARDAEHNDCHFGIRIDGRGEACWLTDERNATVDPAVLLLCLAGFYRARPGQDVTGADEPCATSSPPLPPWAHAHPEPPQELLPAAPASPATHQIPATRASLPVIVLEEATPLEIERRLTESGFGVVRSQPARAAIFAAMCEHHALLGGGPSGRIWHGGRAPVLDALRVLTAMLVLLSQSDRPLSGVIETTIF